MKYSLLCIIFILLLPVSVLAQALQKNVKLSADSALAFNIDAVEYRSAKWESDALQDVERDTPNQGGLIHIYITNVSKKTNSLKFYQLNNKDESHWLLGRYIAWHRYYDKKLEPGESTVLEINALDPLFSETKPISIRLIGKDWTSAGYSKGILKEDPVRISSIVQDKDLGKILFHVRYTGEGNIQFKSAEVLGYETKQLVWKKHTKQGAGHAIGEIELNNSFSPSDLIILRVLIEEDGEERYVYTHRRAHINSFPIGVWSSRDNLLKNHRRLHIDTVVRGGRSNDDFYSGKRAELGFNTMVHNDRGMDVDQMRSLGNDPGVLCWMLQDEPDWSILPSDMLVAEEATKRINQNIPTMITLCRNVKFFEYASISDIPVHDHYCVGAPTSTKWPTRFGTRLEETGYYTRDLKEASEPKPIWVWTQGIADWDIRPKRYCPTPGEIAAQLMFNIGRGAKGILWFNWNEQAAQDYPDSVESYQQWGRVMRTIRPDLLQSDPITLKSKTKSTLDVVQLATPEALVVCMTNQQYDIKDDGYQFSLQEDVSLSIEIPQWLKNPIAYSITPQGIIEHSIKNKRDKATLQLGDIEVSRLVILTSNPSVLARHQTEYNQALIDEKLYAPQEN